MSERASEKRSDTVLYENSLLLYFAGTLTGERLKALLNREGLDQALKEDVYLTKPNVREFRELVGEHIKEESQIKAEAQKMVKSGRCELLVISLGAAAVMTPGTELCRREDVERLYAQMI